MIRRLGIALIVFLLAATLRGVEAAGENFSIVVLPDTQYYSQSYPNIFNSQTQWIVNQRNTLNIPYVAHVGDIVQTSSDATQYTNASNAMALLEDPVTTGLADGIPYGVVPGNHDEAGLYNVYFGVSRFVGRPYYGGSFPEGDNEHNYTLFSAGGMDFIVLNMDYLSPAYGNIAWADALLKTYNTRRAIVVSHSILNADGSFSSRGSELFEGLKNNPNFFLMLCGHVGGSEVLRSDSYEGRPIYSLLADYQTRTLGGTGWLRIMEFSPETDQIFVKTYSPYLDQWETDGNSQFTLAYNMSDTVTPTPTPSVSPTPTPVPDETLTFSSVADAMIKKDAPSSNYGSNTTLTVDSSPMQQALVKYDVAGVSGRTVTSAKIRLYYTAGSNATGGWVYRAANDSWVENQVTWNSAPATLGDPLYKYGAVGMQVWYEADVTPAITGDGPVSFRILSNNTDGANFSSKESVGFAPQLVIKLESTGTPTPTPIVTPTPTPIETPTPTPTPIVTPTPTPIETPTPTPTPIPTPLPSPTPTPTPIVTPTPTPIPGGTETLTFPVAADAMLKQDYPNSNYGTNTTLTIDGSPVQQALMKFAITGINGRTVTNAKMRLYYTAGSNATGGVVYRTEDTSWIESQVTWSTAPTADATPIINMGAVSYNVWKEVDVTPAIAGDGTISFRITSTNSDGANFSSKEAATNKPELVVTVSN